MSWRLGGSGEGGERVVVFGDRMNRISGLTGWGELFGGKTGVGVWVFFGGKNLLGKVGWDVDRREFGTTTD